MGFELIDGHTGSEAMPGPAGEPQLSPRRHWWWTGSEWVMAGGHPDGCAALGRPFRPPPVPAPAPAPPPPAPVVRVPPPPPPPAPVAVVPEQPHPDWATGTVTVLGPTYTAPPPSRWEPLWTHRVRILKGLAAAVVMAVVATLVHLHLARVHADALKTVTADLLQIAQFEHMANVYSDGYASHGQLLRNGWTEPERTTLTFNRVVRRLYCVTGTLHGVTRTVRQNEVVSTQPC